MGPAFALSYGLFLSSNPWVTPKARSRLQIFSFPILSLFHKSSCGKSDPRSDPGCSSACTQQIHTHTLSMHSAGHLNYNNHSLKNSNLSRSLMLCLLHYIVTGSNLFTIYFKTIHMAMASLSITL